MAKDKTKYLFNSKTLGKSRLVLAVIKQYIADQSPSYEQLKLIFPDSIQGKYTIIQKDEYQNKLKASDDISKRFFVDDDINLSDGDVVLVSNQWGIGNIDGFIKKAIDIGYKINILNGKTPVVTPSVKTGSGLNRIYYGPPGTGKTYNTINGALQIIDNDYYLENENNRSVLKNKFDEYVKEGRIGFVTFHQSFSYEDFVEGIRAEADDGKIQYFVQDGIFKQLCEKAIKNDTSTGIDEAIQQIIDHLEEKPLHLHTSSGKGFTVTHRGGRTFRIKPDSSDKSFDYAASIENIKKVFRGASLKDVYNPSYVLSILEYLKTEYGLSNEPVTNTQKEPVVLIIDEINRGNTANIFGELITLIEPSKRAGAEEALSVVLPYSKERFSVPDNLYIIGTMNTADRSLALIDTALRRRFQFEEMLPQPELLSEINIDGVDILQLLTIINKRIALLYDREHTLGHSFFLSLNEDSTIQNLREIFEGQILPLLEEYFFEDWEKIRQVLGDPLKPKDLQIIKPDIDEEEVMLLLGDGNNNMLNSLYYRDQAALLNPQAYISIYERD